MISTASLIPNYSPKCSCVIPNWKLFQVDGICSIGLAWANQVNISQPSRNMWKEGEGQPVLNSAISFTNYKKITDKIKINTVLKFILPFKYLYFIGSLWIWKKYLNIILSMGCQFAIKIFTSKSPAYLTFISCVINTSISFLSFISFTFHFKTARNLIY